jgi:hypothetical protein
MEVGNHLPTSPQYLASKRAQYPPNMDKIIQKLLKKSIKIIRYSIKTH